MRKLVIQQQNLKPFHIADGVGHPLRPSIGCKPFIEDWSTAEVVLLGGSGGGKTLSAVWKLLQATLINAVDKNGELTFCPSLYVAPDWRMTEQVGVQMMKKLCQYFGIRYKFMRKDHKFVLTDFCRGDNETFIWLASASNADSLFGIEVGYIVCDEVAIWRENEDHPDEDSFIQVPQRLRHPAARVSQIAWVSTPQGSANHFARLAQSDSPHVKTYIAATNENPNSKIAIDYVQRLENSPVIPKHLLDQYLRGIIVDLRGGRAFESFAEDKNIDDTLRLDHTKPLHVAWDFGWGKNNCHVILGHWEPEDDTPKCKRGTFTSIYEIVKGDIRRCCEAIKKIIVDNGGFKYPAVHIFGDASGKTKQAGATDSCYSLIEQYFDRWGIKFPQRRTRIFSHNPLVKDRINAANWHLCNIDGKVCWKIHSRCRELLLDLKECQFDDKGTNLSKDDKYRTHSIDADSYRIYYLSYGIPTSQQIGYRQAGRISA